MSAVVIQVAINDYLLEHPDYHLTVDNHHTASLAIQDEVYHYMVNRFGITEYWWLMINAVQTWFEPGEKSEAFDDVYDRLFSASGLAVTSGGDIADEFGKIWLAFIKHYKCQDIK